MIMILIIKVIFKLIMIYAEIGIDLRIMILAELMVMLMKNNGSDEDYEYNFITSSKVYR